MNRVEMTIELHKSGGLSCSQAILAAFGESCGIDREKARLLGRTLTAGIGWQGETCGYITGALLVLAHVYNDKNEALALEKTRTAVEELIERFRERYGTMRCNDLLGADRTTEEGKKKIRAENLPSRYCYSRDGIGQFVAEVLESLI